MHLLILNRFIPTYNNDMVNTLSWIIILIGSQKIVKYIFYEI
jgi:hypothetical protein